MKYDQLTHDFKVIEKSLDKPLNEIDFMAQQCMGELIDMGMSTIEEWVTLEENAIKYGLPSPTDVYEEYRKLLSTLRGLNNG